MRTRGFFLGSVCDMNSLLPTTGTNALLEQLSPFVPDGFLREQWPHTATGGRQGNFSAAQLWRVHLLALLTPVHSVNLLLEMLPEQRAWRQFAHLPNRHRIPDVRMLHEFRRRVGVAGLRRINEVLLVPLLEGLDPSVPAIALMDATDLPAACRGFKKSPPAPTRPCTRPSAGVRSRPVRAAGSSATKNTRCDCGSRLIQRMCCWRRWSLGWLPPMSGKVDCWFQRWACASSVGAGGPITSWWTWAIWQRQTNRYVGDGGKWPCSLICART